MKKILLLWYMQDDNFGDVLISRTIKDYFEPYDCVMEDHEVGDYWRNIVKHANECDFLLFAGGGIIERGVPNVIINWDKVAEELRIPYGVIGLGMGEFNHDGYSEKVRAWVDNAEFFFVRDQYTQEKMNDYSHSKKVIFSADCVFANKNLKADSNKAQGKIAINVRDLPYEDLTGALDWATVNTIIKKSNIEKLIMDSSDEMNNSCIFDAEENSRYLKMDKNAKTEYIIHNIAECRAIVAMRFHVVLVAARMGIPSVPIEYCPKVKYLSEQLGLQNLSVTIENLSDIPDKVNELMDHMEYYQKLIRENVIILEKKADEMFRYVTDIIFREN